MLISEDVRNRVKEAVGYTCYLRGKKYWEQGRVEVYAESGCEDGWKFNSIVRGTRRYHVRGVLTSEDIGVSCDCPAYSESFVCKHCAAALLECLSRHSENKQLPRSDDSVKALLTFYGGYQPEKEADLPESSESGTEPGSCTLLPRLDLRKAGYGYYRTSIGLSFRIGIRRLYVVKDLSELLKRFREGTTAAYGAGLVLTHRREVLDEASQRRLDFLCRHMERYEAVCFAYNEGYGLQNGPFNTVHLEGREWDDFFEMEKGNTVEATTLASNSVSLVLKEEDPKLSMKAEAGKGCVTLKIPGTLPDTLLSGKKLYLFTPDSIIRTSESFAEAMSPFLDRVRSSMQISESDLPAFCSVILPFISRFVRIEDPEGVLKGYEPQPCTVCFYFDKGYGDSVAARLKFRYDDREIPENGSFEGIRRNVRAEKLAQNRLFRDSFHAMTGGYALTDGTDAAFNFLTQKLPAYQQIGEVYLSDSLKRMELAPDVGNVSLSMTDGMLTMNFDTGGFPVNELEALYESMLLRKHYHRLKDGRFMRIQGSAAESLAETAHMLQLKPGEIAGGEIRLPAFRALYLDGMLNGNNSLLVSRDRVLRDMIRRFKTFNDSDDQVPETLRGVLRPYQETGFRWLKTLESCGFGGILADEMGLGKTLQVIAWLSASLDKAAGRPSLIVCPTSLVLNWQDEFAKFAPQLSVRPVCGTAGEREKRIADPEQACVWITSYDLLKRDIAHYADREFYGCILDEGQFIKNQGTKASKAVKMIRCVQRFVLTGTPIENRLSDLWNLFDFLMPGYLFAHERFTERLEKPIIQSGDQQARERLTKLVQPFLLRRLKKDVLKELPPKISNVQYVALSEEERKLYHACVIQTLSELKESGEKLAILAALTRLRQICCDPGLCFENYEGPVSKLETCVELVSGLAENGHQILMFSQFTSMLDRIRPLLEKAGVTTYTLQGSTDRETRARLVKDFNGGGAQVFLISLKAGGTGLNLTAADVVIHYDPWWNQAAQNQATDRAHRIGQKQCVQVYRLIAKDTIEESILELQEKKAAMLENIAGEGGESLMSMSRDDLLALIGESTD